MAVSVVVVVALAAVALVALLDRLVLPRIDATEPPVVRPTVPIIGHVLGMVLEGPAYYTKLSRRTGLPIFTLPVPFGRIYVMHTPELAAQADRQPRVFAFSPYVMLFTERLMEPTAHAVHELRKNMSGEGGWGVRTETERAMHVAMAKGDNLTEMSRVLARSLWPFLANVPRAPAAMPGALGQGRFHLFGWCKHIASIAMTDAAYGLEHNPFHDAKVEESYWHMISQFALLGVNILPAWTARRAYRARTYIFDAFAKYYAQGAVSKSSPLIRGRFKVEQAHSLSMQDSSRFNVGMIFALLVNSVPTTFWTIFHAYSRPELVATLRHELETGFVRSEPAAAGSPDAAERRVVDLARVAEECLRLRSFVEEVLRLESANASGRGLLTDTVVDGRYVLKKGANVMTPSIDLHENTAVWGANAHDFDATRFLAGRPGARVPAAAYRAWGGGASRCSGRHLFMNEAAILLAVLLLRFDVAPHPPGAPWRRPKSVARIPASMYAPVTDLEVRFSDRPGMEHVQWAFSWGDMPLEDPDPARAT